MSVSTSKTNHDRVFMSPNEHSGKNSLFLSHSDFTPPDQSRSSTGEFNNRHSKKVPGINYMNMKECTPQL
ncbi:hypothetical protein OnM2_039024 [Erysiphe neolycopersici]|uniref:Uncharacterized protein n=1 Tax=Erysiphe neolycopersici TaxID=212602 RepID=A0A420HWC1_9PEZI|nr:hypothetical protein OnM2_039024 [Erysiphe neolycopersici]